MQTEARVLEWGLAWRNYPGETTSGDLSLVKLLDKRGLVAVVDALGHGRDAAPAAVKAIQIIDRYAHEPLPSILQRCHAELIGTRGVVMSLAAFDSDHHEMSWLGIGNVDGLLVTSEAGDRSRSTMLLTRAGIVGGDMPKANPWVVPLSPGDTLVVSTDGLRTGFAGAVLQAESPQEIADRILGTYAKGTDDALVLVVRYLGDR